MLSFSAPHSQDFTDVELAARIALGAGAIVTAVATQQVLRGVAHGLAADATAQQWIAQVLAFHRPADAVLSEEAPDTSARQSHSRVWIIDPLDGTNSFVEGTAEWAVHVGLWQKDHLLIGAVFLPGHPVFRSDTVAAAVGTRSLPLTGKVVVQRRTRHQVFERMAQDMGLSLVQAGSAGYKAMQVVLGQADAYMHTGGQYQWDSCAPVAIAQAAGLHTSRLDGSPLLYNHPDVYLHDLLICRPELTSELIASYRTHHMSLD